MTRLALAASMMLALGACAELNTGLDLFREKACDDTLEERYARAVLFEKYTGQTGAFDCDGDGVADDLGYWTGPGE